MRTNESSFSDFDIQRVVVLAEEHTHLVRENVWLLLQEEVECCASATHCTSGGDESSVTSGGAILRMSCLDSSSRPTPRNVDHHDLSRSSAQHLVLPMLGHENRRKK